MKNNNVIKFPENHTEKWNPDRLFFTQDTFCQIFSILDFNKNFNYLIEKIKKTYPEFNIKSFSDFDRYEIDNENNQFIFIYRGIHWFISLNNISEEQYIKQAKEIEKVGEFIYEYWAIINSWYANMWMETLININNYYIDSSKNIIEFMLWGQKYSCSLDINPKSRLRKVQN